MEMELYLSGCILAVMCFTNVDIASTITTESLRTAAQTSVIPSDFTSVAVQSSPLYILSSSDAAETSLNPTVFSSNSERFSIIPSQPSTIHIISSSEAAQPTTHLTVTSSNAPQTSPSQIVPTGDVTQYSSHPTVTPSEAAQSSSNTVASSSDSVQSVSTTPIQVTGNGTNGWNGGPCSVFVDSTLFLASLCAVKITTMKLV